MIRAYKLVTNADGDTNFKQGSILLNQLTAAKSIQFKEDPPYSSSGFHDAPNPQFVLILSGTLECTSKTGECFVAHPGDVMIADDLNGTGHTWKLVDDQPWRRPYVAFDSLADLLFIGEGDV